jgi:hypothetical protein
VGRLLLQVGTVALQDCSTHAEKTVSIFTVVKFLDTAGECYLFASVYAALLARFHQTLMSPFMLSEQCLHSVEPRLVDQPSTLIVFGIQAPQDELVNMGKIKMRQSGNHVSKVVCCSLGKNLK